MADSGPGPTSHTYFSQRLRLHYVDWGNPAKPPLLLVHGGRDHCRNWDWVAGALHQDWHVLAPDLRGHGDSQWSPDGNRSEERRVGKECRCRWTTEHVREKR